MMGHPPKNEIAESTQQKVIQQSLNVQKNFKMKAAESTTENFEIII